MAACIFFFVFQVQLICEGCYGLHNLACRQYLGDVAKVCLFVGAEKKKEETPEDKSKCMLRVVLSKNEDWFVAMIMDPERRTVDR